MGWPHRSGYERWARTSLAGMAEHGARRQAAQGPATGMAEHGAESAETESGREFRPVYRPADLAGFDPEQRLGEPGALPVHPRALRLDVHRPAVDDAPVRRVRHGRGVQRRLPPAGRATAPAGSASPSTCRRRWASTPTTRWRTARSARSAWPSTRSRTCARSSTASRSTRSRRR